ncbi:hypothetical protein MJ579_12865 [Klebsiella pneumoniae]|nr:hypothetical protein MJ579_12865 [Klebsiella pneumoniae]
MKGSPPGYVGYGQAGSDRAVRKRPYSVVLLDEVGKGPSRCDEPVLVFDRG